MEILELQNRIKNLFELVYNAKSDSTKRRYFIWLSNLIMIYIELVEGNENYSLDEVTTIMTEYKKISSPRIIKSFLWENFIREINRTGDILYKLSDGILRTRKEVDCNFRERFNIRLYSQKEISELVETFLASLGEKFYKLYQEIITDKRLFFTKDFGEGETIFDYQKLESIIFVSKNRNSLASALTFVHEVGGHAFEYDYKKFLIKPYLSTKININCEVFAMFIELLFLDYLKSIHFDNAEVSKMEEKFYNDLIGFASEINFALSISIPIISSEGDLLIYDFKEANKVAKELAKKYGVSYYLDNICLMDSFNYMYGGLIATIYSHYYEQDKSFMREIFKHFMDYEFYTTEEILGRLPFVFEELGDYPILRKRLEQIKANQI